MLENRLFFVCKFKKLIFLMKIKYIISFEDVASPSIFSFWTVNIVLSIWRLQAQTPTVADCTVPPKIMAGNYERSDRVHKLCTESSTRSVSKNTEKNMFIFRGLSLARLLFDESKRGGDRWKHVECGAVIPQRKSRYTNLCHQIRSKDNSKIKKHQMTVRSPLIKFMLFLCFTA